MSHSSFKRSRFHHNGNLSLPGALFLATGRLPCPSRVGTIESPGCGCFWLPTRASLIPVPMRPMRPAFALLVLVDIRPQAILRRVSLDGLCQYGNPRKQQQSIHEFLKKAGSRFGLDCLASSSHPFAVFGACCLDVRTFFCQLMGFPIKPLKVFHFEQKSRKQPSSLERGLPTKAPLTRGLPELL